MSAEKQTEQDIISQALNYMDAPELHLSGDEPKSKSKSVSETFQLLDQHLPTLKAGQHQITLHQTIEGTGITTNNRFSTTQIIEVAEPAFQFQPNDVFSVFPPAESTGDHSSFLPYLTLNRSTLPWERPAFDNQKDTPWLALIVVDETETDVNATIKAGGNIELDSDLLSKNSFADLVHVIKKTDESEKAVIIANRLPRINSTTVVHLIAIDQTHFQTEIPASKQSFVSLYNWRFSCSEPDKNFEGIVSNLNTNLLKINAKPQNEAQNALFKKGFAPLPHFMRDGTQTISWYRSPLVAVQKVTGFKIDQINSSDDLLMFDKQTKMLNATYATAWELGRMLTLQEKNVAMSIYNYKRKIAQNHKNNTGQSDLESICNNDEKANDLPNSVKIWLNELLFLKPVPFNYLVPYEAMLPAESLRLFMLDKKWIQSLMDGAMSIGRVFEMKNVTKSTKTLETIELTWSGFLLRSELIADYPDLEIIGGNQEPIHTRKLGGDVLLVLFKNARINEIDFFLKADGIQFGFDFINDKYELRLKNEAGETTTQLIDIELNNRIVDFSTLKTSLKSHLNTTLHSASLALQLMKSPKRIKIKNVR